VIAVSKADVEIFAAYYGATASDIPTGVDLEYFAPVSALPREVNLIFLGSMDWMPNIDGVRFFVEEVLPLIRQANPACSLDIVGRNPPPQILALAERDPRIRVTGTVPDVRPYLWSAEVAIVPLRIGGGTRLKIYEAMAAGTPVVSTTIGAEGLPVRPETDIRIGDDPRQFARACLELLLDRGMWQRQVQAAHDTANRYSSESVSRRFGELLERAVGTVVPPRQRSV
jgi:glycosyltransferase involved in cell wall biosynthesis